MNRRDFIQKTGVAATPLLFGGLLSACTPSSKTEEKKVDSTSTAALTTEPSIKNFGLQLWTVKEDMLIDPKGTLKALAGYGYKQIESFQSEKGIFWGMKPAEFKMLLDDLGMTIISSHCDSQYSLDPKKFDEFKKLADDAASAGLKYLINPYLGFLKTLDEFKKATEGFNKQGEVLKASGMRFAYHNHHYSFTKMDGQFPQDIMINGSNPETVDFEMDMYWVTAAKQNPIEWLKKYPNRFKLCHIKDIYGADKVAEIQKSEKVNPDFPINASCILGTGTIDFAKILPVAKDNGVQYFIVEQERFDKGTRLESVDADAAYMKKLVFA